jgi:hypothetical protein
VLVFDKKSPLRNPGAGCVSSKVDARTLYLPGDYLEAVAAFEMMISTRRFCSRPPAVSLLAIGEPSPRPAVDNRPESMPWPIRYERTELARRCDRLKLESSLPTLSVWPSM